MNNLNKLDTEVDVTTLDLSRNEEIEINEEAVNLQSVDNEKQLKSTDYEPDAVTVLKMDPAIIEARVVNDYSYGDPFPEQDEEQVPEANASDWEERLGFAEYLAALQQSARLSITPQQCALLILYANHLKRLPPRNSPGECVFCKNNGESIAWYRSHTIKDRRGRVVCPILRSFCCPICGASGSRAHTPKHCPVNKYGFSF
ncbi:PREDICTED: nanos homolog 3-like [Papilio polytes]|uniref:nanos homolog 3-like n=1 Tax=Papilio polytes TaxID=76194 RepID=UPI0006761A5A|nr:PREDICTED: nanos homolog 3-like [Papilio polytes]